MIINMSTVSFSKHDRTQWRSQVIGIGRAPAVRLTIVLTTLALSHTHERDKLWAGMCLARPGLCVCVLMVIRIGFN